MEKKLKDMGVELNELAIAMCDYIQTGQKKLPYGDEKDKVVAGFVRDENENNKYICVSDELNIDYDTFIADSVEDAKKQVEGMLLDHWKEQIVYLEDCIDLLQNGKE